MSKMISIPKYSDSTYVNEDAVGTSANRIVVSDGAGGGGVYADKWSKYLVDNLPDTPISTFEELDSWVEGIWEAFYNEYEDKAKAVGGLLLEKFYDEGSFATLAALWKVAPDVCKWCTYGDSVLFHYNTQTKVLQHSFGQLVDFNLPPYLINYNEPLKSEGFKSGEFVVDKDSVVFATSDALAHYIIMMYEVSKRDEFNAELEAAINAQSKNSNAITTAFSFKSINFEKDVLFKLLRSIGHRRNFALHLEALKRKELLMEDDYTIAKL